MKQQLKKARIRGKQLDGEGQLCSQVDCRQHSKYKYSITVVVTAAPAVVMLESRQLYLYGICIVYSIVDQISFGSAFLGEPV